MEDSTGFYEDELSVKITRVGKNLTLIATMLEEDQWRLSIQNDYGIQSIWHRYFLTAHLAIEAGMKAIEEEGIEQFVNVDGFEYLHE